MPSEVCQIGSRPRGTDILKEDGSKVVDTQVLQEPGETTYVISALPAGTYTFQCSVHPSVPNMNGTLTVK